MSGGSWEYIFSTFESVAERLASSSDERRVALSRVVAALALAMHDIEWVDSYDYSPGDEHASIDAVFKAASGNINAVAFEILKERAQQTLARLEELAKGAKK